MNQMTPAQARVIDPILTEIARGYGGNQAPIADILFPTVPVAQRGGRIIAFGPDDFKLYSTARAPGAARRSGRNVGSKLSPSRCAVAFT